jgi:hypothetical protein
MKVLSGLIAFALALMAQPALTLKEAAVRAFQEMSAVMLSPRCINCHARGDAPLEGDDHHVHTMRVARGSDGGGTPAMRCTNCHQEANIASLHAPPGVSGWRMPGEATPMAWQGLTAAELCQSLRGRATNGNRGLAQLRAHVTSDKLVNWAWNPGPGRTVPPLSHTEFVERVKTWTAAGGPCPE